MIAPPDTTNSFIFFVVTILAVGGIALGISLIKPKWFPFCIVGFFIFAGLIIIITFGDNTVQKYAESVIEEIKHTPCSDLSKAYDYYTNSTYTYASYFGDKIEHEFIFRCYTNVTSSGVDNGS